MQFPPLGLLNRWFIGDNVLLEPIARQLAAAFKTDVYVVSAYPELFLGHPTVRSVSLDGAGLPEDVRIIDLTDAIKSLEGHGKKQIALPNKLARMYKDAGLSLSSIETPRLYLTDQERSQATEVRKFFGDKCIGVVLRSRHDIKTWQASRWLIRHLVKEGADVFVIGDRLQRADSYLLRYPVHYLVGRSLREVMVYLSMMDLVIGPDTGPMHMAGALGTSIVVVMRRYWDDLYEHYKNCELVYSSHCLKRSLYAISPLRVRKAVRRQLSKDSLSPAVFGSHPESDIAIFRLDGLGGTLTMSDQAKKIYDKTGLKSVIITRGYKDVFQDNPHIADVIEVGHVKWATCVERMKQQFGTIAEIRFAIGKWHQDGTKLFEQDFVPLQGMFDEFPRNYNKLETNELHHVQLTDKTLNLPYDTIDSKIYAWKDPPPGLPFEYIVFANGVDIQHTDMRQTKVWNGWDELIATMDYPFVQVGTVHDPLARGAIDLRGKTDVLTLFGVLKAAKVVLCTEGGIMHLAYAAQCPKVVVLRGPTCGKLFAYPSHRLVDSRVCNNCWSTTDDWYERCPRGLKAACMESIISSRVMYNIKEVLSESVA